MFPRFDGADPSYQVPAYTGAVLQILKWAFLWYRLAARNDGLWQHPLYSTRFALNGWRDFSIQLGFGEHSGHCHHHWIATFHDDTLEVVAASAVVVSVREEGENTVTTPTAITLTMRWS